MVDLALQILFWLKGLQFEHQDLCIDISKVTHNLVFNLGWALYTRCQEQLKVEVAIGQNL